MDEVYSNSSKKYQNKPTIMIEPKIVITMTSWTKRIGYVAKAIYRFLSTQTVKPDLFYLWLAEEEFPNKEKDLPEELLLVCDAFDINLCWTKENEYCHKRWYVYPKHYNDIVIAIDDDLEIDCDLCKFAKSKQNENKVYTIYNDLTAEISVLNGIKLKYKATEKSSNKNKLSGCSIYEPKTFPLECISPENVILRKKFCKKCDESWILPFLIYNKTERSFSYKQKIKCLWNTGIAKDGVFNSYNVKFMLWKHFQIYIVLRLFPKLMESWKKEFPTYNDNNFKDKSLDELITLLK